MRDHCKNISADILIWAFFSICPENQVLSDLNLASLNIHRQALNLVILAGLTLSPMSVTHVLGLIYDLKPKAKVQH